MIDQPTIDRILDAANIVDVVSEFVTLRKRGVNFVGLCPFHADKTPSFYVSPAKNICKCFACGEGGTAVHFIMKHEQLNYYDALRYLAKKYNIEIQEKELTNVSNWDEISFLYSCVCWLKHTTLDYLDIPVIVYEDPQLVLLIRQIRRSSFIWSVEMKHSMSFCIISEMSKNIQKFYSLYLSLCKYAKQMNELHVGDEEAAKLLSIPVNYK